MILDLRLVVVRRLGCDNDWDERWNCAYEIKCIVVR